MDKQIATNTFDEALATKSVQECLRCIGRENLHENKEKFALRTAAAFLGSPNASAVFKKIDKLLPDRKLLHLASFTKDCSLLKALLEQCPAIDAVDSQGRTALHWAAMGNNTNAMRLLKKGNAIINAVDLKGKNALHLAAENSAIGTLSLLKEWNSPIDAFCVEGRTAMHYAAAANCEEALIMLKNWGANLNHPDHTGRTPIVVALENREGENSFFCLYDLGAKIGYEQLPRIRTRDYDSERQKRLLKYILALQLCEKNKSDCQDFFTLAVKSWWPFMVKRLLTNQSVNLNKKGEKNESPLDFYSDSYSFHRRGHQISFTLLMLLRNPYLKLSLHRPPQGDISLLIGTSNTHIKEMRSKIAALYYLARVEIARRGEVVRLPREIIKKIVNHLTELTWLPTYLVTTYDVFSQLLAQKKIEECFAYILFEKDAQERNRLYVQMASMALTHQDKDTILARIESLLTGGAKLVHVAAYYNNRELLEYLKPTIHRLCSRGGTPMHWAAAGNAPGSMVVLQEWGISPYGLDGVAQKTPLFWAIDAHATEVMPLFKLWNAHTCVRLNFHEQQLGAHPITTWETPLHLSAERNDIKMLEILKEWNVDIYASDCDGQTALLRAARANAVEAIKYMLDWCSDVKKLLAMTDNSGKTALSYLLIDAAKMTAQATAILSLIASYVDGSMRDTMERTALHQAIIAGISWEKIKFYGWDKCDMALMQDKDGKTPLHYAAELCRDYIGTMLTSPCYNQKESKQKGLLQWFSADEPRCYVQQGDKNGNTPLHWLARHNFTEVLRNVYGDSPKSFVEKVRNKAGESPVDWATKYGAQRAHDYLIEKPTSAHSYYDPVYDASVTRQQEARNRLGRELTSAEAAYCSDTYRW